jgi:hypothetical protein
MKMVARLGSAVMAGAFLSAIAATAVFGYAGQVAGQVSVAGPSGTIACNTPVTVSATVLDVNGKPFDNTQVTWSFKSGTAQSGDKINPTTSMTNASGVATTTVTLACVAGSRTVNAASGSFVGGAVLGITSAGLPNTSTDPVGTPAWEFAIAALAVLAGLGLFTRQAFVRR